MKYPSIVINCILLFMTSPLIAQGLESDPFALSFKEVQKDIYLGYRPNALRNPVVGNVVIVKNEADVILFDAGRTLSSARQVVEKVKEITSDPVSYVVISHGHIDHVGGLEVYKKYYPHAEIVSRKETRDYMETRVNLNRYIENLKNTIAQRDSIFEQIRQTKDKEIANLEKQYYYKDAELLMQEYQKANIVLPSLIFSGEEVSLYRGNATIKILWLGHGKTSSDIVLYLPEKRLVIAGDMVTYPVPFGFCSEPEQWAKTLRRLLKLEVDYFIPGHGEEICNRTYVETVARLLESTASQVKQLRSKGLSKQEVLSALDLSEYIEFFAHQDIQIMERFHEWYIKPIVGRILDRENNFKAK